MAPYVLPSIVAVTALIDIVAVYRETRTVAYVFKPLSTVLIITLALLAQQADRTYQTLIVVGLLFSLAGDVFLMLPERPRSYFVPGLVAFLFAQLVYIGAFSLGTHWAGIHLVILLPYALFGLVVGTYLWPRLGAMKAPVVLYMIVILGMGWRAGVRVHAADVPITGAVFALVGAVVFILSDLSLAVNRFARPFKAAEAVILSTYFTAQTFIALSLHF